MRSSRAASCRRRATGAVFIAGYPRSGTTLLYRLLASSRAFGSGPPLSAGGEDTAFETAIAFFANPRVDHDAVLVNPWPHWSLAIPDEGVREQLVAPYRAMSFPRRAWEGALSRLVFRDEGIAGAIDDIDDLATRQRRSWAPWPLRYLATKLSIRKRFIRDFITAFGSSHSAEVVLEKYPFHYYYFFELSSALPHAKFVFLYRDPRDVFASLVRRARVQSQQRLPVGAFSWQFISATSFARDWKLSLELAQEFRSAFPSRILFLKYEELTEEPKLAADRLSGFLDLSPPLAIPQAELEKPDLARKFPLRSAMPQPNSDRYRSLLHPDDIAAIVAECRPDLVDMGYEFTGDVV